MTDLGQYVITLSCAALIGGILCGLLGDCVGKELLKLLCGLFLTLCVLKPILEIDLTEITENFLTFSEEATAYSELGQGMAEEAFSEIIKQETEAYILDKAAALRAEVTAEVMVAEGIPVGVRLTGNLSPYSKARMESILETELGIPKENQLWT